jgi:hypothetical protein
MVPAWMIEDLERRRREREDRERPQVRIEAPVRRENERPPRRPAPSGRIGIELGGAPRDDRAARRMNPPDARMADPPTCGTAAAPGRGWIDE